MSGGALAAVLGMIRSPMGRPALVSFLRVVSALLAGIPAPPDFFFSGDHLAVDEGGSGGVARGGGGDPAGASGRYV